MTGTDGLFRAEQEVLRAARTILERGKGHERVFAEDFEWLVRKYEKLFKQAQRLIRFSDRMQNELNRLNERLCQSEKTYRNLFEKATEGIFRSDPTGGLIHINPAMAHILGYLSPAHILEAPCEKSSLEAQEGYRKLLARVADNGGCKEYQAQIMRKQGDCIWVEFSAQAFRDETGRVTHIDGLLQDITQRKKRQERLSRMAHRDGLTGIYNRLRFTEKLKQEVRRSRHMDRPLSLIMIDVDYFKSVNDRFGHNAGDEALKRVTAACQNALREDDVFGRLGGEEFAVILADVDQCRALQIAERLRENVEKDVLCLDDDVIRTTVSVGLCTLNGSIADSEGLLKAADTALYRAKQEGRNRVCVYRP